MFLKEILYFCHTDRLMVGLLLVVACVAGIAFMLTGGGGECSNTAAPDSAATSAPDTKHAAAVTQSHGVAPQVRLFRFDPNTADSLTLLSLGLQPWLVHNVCRYRERGGTYSKPDDFARTYGLTVRQFRALKPYIRISPDFLPASTLVAAPPSKHADALPELRPDTARRTFKLRHGETVPLNTADTAALQRVPGIGGYLARRIVERRSMLGGFSSTAQLMEIDRFPASAQSYFTVDRTAVRRLDVNRLTLSQLRSHPYINFYQARAIADYRRLYGRIETLETLRRLKEFSESDIVRLAPYLSF